MYASANLHVSKRALAGLVVVAFGNARARTHTHAHTRTHTHPHAPTRTHTHPHAHTRAHTHTHAQAAAIKLGMLGTPEIMNEVADLLDGYSGAVILDPVMISTSGGWLGWICVHACVR